MPVYAKKNLDVCQFCDNDAVVVLTYISEKSGRPKLAAMCRDCAEEEGLVCDLEGRCSRCDKNLKCSIQEATHDANELSAFRQKHIKIAGQFVMLKN